VPAGIIVPTFPQRSPPWLLTKAARGGLGISDLIAEPEGPTFISYKVARSLLNRLRFVTQVPQRTFILVDRTGRGEYGYALE
jgi:hypothetical protein